MTDSTTVDSSEKVARILSTEWFVDGQLMNIAFTLLEGETYISVNRPVINTYHSDVAGFVAKHDKYLFGTDNYKRAMLRVSDIRAINVDAFTRSLMQVFLLDMRTKT